MLAGDGTKTGGSGVTDGELSGGAAGVTMPSRNPASCNVSEAVPRGWPIKLGITSACGWLDPATSKLILGAETPLAFGGGACART